MGSLSLELRVGRETLPGYERALVDGLFFDGDATNTDKIQSHYRALGEGFNPAAVLKPALAKSVEEAVGPDVSKKPWWARLLTAVAVLAALALVVANSEPEVMKPWASNEQCSPAKRSGPTGSASAPAMVVHWPTRYDA